MSARMATIPMTTIISTMVKPCGRVIMLKPCRTVESGIIAEKNDVEKRPGHDFFGYSFFL